MLTEAKDSSNVVKFCPSPEISLNNDLLINKKPRQGFLYILIFMTHNFVIGVTDQLVNVQVDEGKRKINFGQIWKSQ